MTIKRLGVIAGGGSLPEQLLSACDEQNIEPFVIAFKGQTDPEILIERKFMLTRLGAAGSIINTLKSHGIHDLVFIGSIRRPSLKEMRPDFRTLTFFARLATRAIGDDGLLKAMKSELERDGFHLHGVQDFAGHLVAGEGPVGAYSSKDSDQDSIHRGLDVLRAIGPVDVGQGVVVQDGIVLGVEAAEGTDELIRRCGRLRREGRGPILVKATKAGQSEHLDLPTIGPDTVRNLGESGFAGLVFEAGKTLVVQPDKVAELANDYKVFVTGYTP